MFRDPPPAYTRRPSGENANPSPASAIATRAVSFIAPVSTTLIEGRLPAFSASRNFPSGETAALNGSESSATCVPAG